MGCVTEEKTSDDEEMTRHIDSYFPFVGQRSRREVYAWVYTQGKKSGESAIRLTLRQDDVESYQQRASANSNHRTYGMSVYYQITIVPEYSSNQSLETSVKTHLSKLIKGKRYHRNTTLRIIVFRPTGRPADEFKDNVLPVLRDCEEGVYLFIAFSGGSKNISDLVPESVRHKVRGVEPIFIQAGELVSEASANYDKNETAFRSMADLMCREHGLTMNRAEVQSWDEIGNAIFASFYGIIFYVFATLRWIYHRISQWRE